MYRRAAVQLRVGPVACGLLLAALLAWVAVGRGAADLETAGPVAFAGAWTLMMAAMMLPSLVPAGRAVAQFGPREGIAGHAAVAPFTAGYLTAWAVFGLGVGAALAAGRGAGVAIGGSVATATVLVVAALYQLTPAKGACLRRCRNPIGFVVAHSRPGPGGTFRMGALLGAWCTGCCWALMAGLLALGAMNIGWMLALAVLVAGEKLLPWRQAVTLPAAGMLLALAAVEVLA
jgi:predicted metal-binding membrane protein